MRLKSLAPCLALLAAGGCAAASASAHRAIITTSANCRALICELGAPALAVLERELRIASPESKPFGASGSRAFTAPIWGGDAEINLCWSSDDRDSRLVIEAYGNHLSIGVARQFLAHLRYEFVHAGVRAEVGPVTACVVPGPGPDISGLHDVICAELATRGDYEFQAQARLESAAVAALDRNGRECWRVEYDSRGESVVLDVVREDGRVDPWEEERVLVGILKRLLHAEVEFVSADV